MPRRRRPTPARPARAMRADAWERVRRRLRAEIGEEVYSSWFPRIELDGVSAGLVRLSVPTRFLKAWIQQHYLDRLGDLWREELSGARVELVVRSAVMRAPVRWRPAPPRPRLNDARGQDAGPPGLRSRP